MMKRIIAVLLLNLLVLSLAACASNPAATEAAAQPEETVAETTAMEGTEAGAQPAVAALEDGVYTVDFTTDSGMFHVNEALEGKGKLVVQDGAMTVHVTLVSKSILNLYPGSAEDAKKDEANWLRPTEDEVTYKDGFKETVYGFDVPVPVLEEEFPLALIGKKGTWYDHMVSVSNPVPVEE